MPGGSLRVTQVVGDTVAELGTPSGRTAGQATRSSGDRRYCWPKGRPLACRRVAGPQRLEHVPEGDDTTGRDSAEKVGTSAPARPAHQTQSASLRRDLM